MSENQEKKELLSVKVFWSPTVNKDNYEGQAVSVSSENQIGPFDILPEHANFVSQVFNSLRIVTENSQEIRYQFSRGVMEVSENQVRIFLGV